MPSAKLVGGEDEDEDGGVRLKPQQQHNERASKRQKLSSLSSTAEGKQQQRNLPAAHRRTHSRIFAPFRTIGLVSPTAVPFTSVPLGKTTFQITTSVGRALQTYDLRRGLNLVFITRPQTPGLITATLAVADRVLAAWTIDHSRADAQEKGVWIFQRGKKIGSLQTPPALDQDIVQLQAFGSWIVGCCSTRIEVWHAGSGQHHATLTAEETAGVVLTGGICNLPTFTNKILAGREDGSVELWNVSTAKLIYTIYPPSADCGPITAIQPSPVLSLVAIAYMDGNVIIQDVQLDLQILKIHAANAAQSPITCISFRSDGLGAGRDGREPGVMATASFNSGDVTLWDLNDGGKRAGMLRNAHAAPSPAMDFDAGGISKIEFLPGQAILVTCGLDNSLKTWMFDEVPFSSVPRILHSRVGHAAPVTTLNFLPPEADGTESIGKWLMSSSRDRSLWGWSLRRDGQSTELSQGAIQKKAKRSGTLSTSSADNPNSIQDFKAPKIKCLAASLNRDGGIGTMPGVRTMWTSARKMKGKSTATEQNVTGWESVVTGHDGEAFARTWFWGRKRAGRWILETSDGSPVQSVAMSPCGTFALIGSAKGGIDLYNLQSGLHRQRYPAPLTKAQAKQAQAQVNGHVPHISRDGTKKWPRGHGRHTNAVTGLQIDSLNRTMISCGLDKKVKFWDFTTGDLVAELDWANLCTPEQMIFHRQSDLIAISCSDSHIRVIDVQTRRVVREFTGCKGQIIDLCFSNDGRWTIAASSDSVIRVWDIPTGHLIDAIRLPQLCTALAFSNTGEYLAVAQEDEVGVQLWSNRTLFTHVPTHQIPDDDIAELQGPTASGEGSQNIAVAATDSTETETPLPDECQAQASVEQLSKDVTTLSLIPKSRWQTLLHLDLIRARNKPKEPPKAPEKAPFFLPSLLQQQRAQQPDASQVPEAPDTNDPESTSSAPTPSKDQSRISRLDTSSTTTTFTRLLHTSLPAATPNEAFVAHLKSLPAPSADVAIRSLDPAPPYKEYIAFVHAMTAQLAARRDYELVQAWMAVFLRCHGEVLQEALQGVSGRADMALSDPEDTTNTNVMDEDEDGDGDGTDESNGQQDLFLAMKNWRDTQRRERDRLGTLVGYCSGVVGFLRSTR